MFLKTNNFFESDLNIKHISSFLRHIIILSIKSKLMDSFFNSFSSLRPDSSFHHDFPEKFSSFGSFKYHEILKKDFQKGFLLDFDSSFRKPKRFTFNLKEGFSLAKRNDLSFKVFRKISLFFQHNDILKVEAKISHFSMESLKFNLNSNFAFFKNLKIYSSLKPYYTKNYSFSKIGFRSCRKGLMVDSRLEFDKSINLGMKGIFFPNNFFFCGGLLKFGLFNYDLRNLSLILGIRKPEYEIIFRNETFYFPDVKKVGLCVSQNINKNISLAAQYKFTTKERIKKERNNVEFGFIYGNNTKSHFKMKVQNFSYLKTSTKIGLNDYLDIIVSNSICLRQNCLKNHNLRDQFGIRLNLNLV